MADNPAAFEAVFHNTRNVLGRKVLQIILEVPLEKAYLVHEILGMPDPEKSKWVAVALLDT